MLNRSIQLRAILGAVALSCATVQLKIHAQVEVPASAGYPLSAADTSKPGFIWNMWRLDASKIAAGNIAAFEQNSTAQTELALTGYYVYNDADPTVKGNAPSDGVWLGAPNQSALQFILPTTVNLDRSAGSNGHFQPEDQMPGLPGTDSSTDNPTTGVGNGTDGLAVEILYWVAVPQAETITFGVTSDDGFRTKVGGVAPQDAFAQVAGEFNGGRGANDTMYNVKFDAPGLYPFRTTYENGGGGANVSVWYQAPDGTPVLLNDNSNPTNTLKTYRALLSSTSARAYARSVDPGVSATGVPPNEGIHVSLVGGTTAVPQSSIALSLDGAPITPSISATGTVTKIDFTPSSSWTSLSQHTASLVFNNGTATVTNTWNFTVQYYISLDPAWRVTNVDTNKPGFNWNIYANSDSGRLSPNGGQSNERVERDLTQQAVDANGTILPNLASPIAVGAASGTGTTPTPNNAPVHFEITKTLNVGITDSSLPGSPGTDGNTGGQAAEVITYITLPAGLIAMEIDSDNSWRLYAGPQPADAFGRVVVGEGNDVSGPSQFSFNVSQPGTYPFRLIWGNGSSTGAHINWYSATSSGSTTLINDIAHGGYPAYRALLASAAVAPYVAGVAPIPAIHQMEVANTNLVVLLVDGTTTVADSSVTLNVDGKTITPVTKRSGSYLRVSDGGTAFPSLQLPSDVHSATLTYKDSGGNSRTQTWTFNNIQILQGIPATPLAQENFDSYPESTSPANTVPPGWTAWNYTAENTAGWDIGNKGSDTFLNWVLISTTDVTAIEGSSLNNDPNQTVNGQPVSNFASGNVLWATSDGRSGVQAQFCTSKPFDLSGATNPVMIYSSLMRASGGANVQADSIEYSVDGGNTWNPGVIYIGTANHTEGVQKLLPDGSIDAVRTLNTPYAPLVWVDPKTGQNAGGTHGSALAEPITSALAPYVAIRSDVTATSTKVDGIRLPKASKQKSVILRFAQVGNCSWWWGVDNLAFYDIAPTATGGGGGTTTNPQITGFVRNSDGSLTLTWSGGGTLQSATSVTGPWQNVSGAATPYSLKPTGPELFLRVQ